MNMMIVHVRVQFDRLFERCYYLTGSRSNSRKYINDRQSVIVTIILTETLILTKLNLTLKKNRGETFKKKKLKKKNHQKFT